MLKSVFENSWRNVLEDWRRPNVCNFNKGKEKDPGKYRLVSLINIFGKVLKQILNSIFVSTWIRLQQLTRGSMHGFITKKYISVSFA